MIHPFMTQTTPCAVVAGVHKAAGPAGGAAAARGVPRGVFAAQQRQAAQGPALRAVLA